MRRSTDRILVSHAGNLPRPDELNELIHGGLVRDLSLSKDYQERLPKAVRWIVERQAEIGVDIVNDGEYVKAGSYGGYMQDRVSGFETRPADPGKPPKRAGTAERDRRDFPGFFASGLWFAGSGGPVRPGFATPGEVRQLGAQVRVFGAREVHSPRGDQGRRGKPQGCHRRQGRRGLHRCPRTA